MKEGYPAGVDIAFGTSGVRGRMGNGPGNINVSTMRAITQGVADYLLSAHNPFPSALVGYDSRKNSDIFAKEIAIVLAANDIKVFISNTPCTTPFISFGCRHLSCDIAIMVTASHNPPDDNGYKVYWSGGVQALPPHDGGIVQCVKRAHYEHNIKPTGSKKYLITKIDSSVEQAYYDALVELQHTKHKNKLYGKSLQIVYSSLHGTGITTLPYALKLWGFGSISYVASQITLDGDFPCAKDPNPENNNAIELGINQLKDQNGDILFVTDPDGDRIRVVPMDHGSPVPLSGNQVGVLCLEYLCVHTDLDKKPYGVISSLTTTPLFDEIAKAHRVPQFKVLVGFKYIGQMVSQWEENGTRSFLFGAEESLGYLYGTHARDKDATASACLISEMALNAKLEGLSLVDKLDSIYETYGKFSECQRIISKNDTNQSCTNQLRNNPLSHICGMKVIYIEDYLGGYKNYELPDDDLIIIHLDDLSQIVIRPSGTEAKDKIYILARGDLNKAVAIEKAICSHLRT